MMAAKALSVVETHKQSFRRAVEAGVKIAMGTDAGVGRHGDNGQELVLMVEDGMTPMQAIVASTSSAAQLLRMDHDLGTLETGKLADVIIIDGDVLSDISKIADPANVKLVLKGGQAAKNTLDALVPMLVELR
ncbi:MAG TPA: amidohydrolase family protein [Ktedonobacteraceae bacterium]|nr:amidohydrolase family protein [Ktedonobacteraceae bacterium]